MIVGALCHDIDHPGLNNDFLVKQAIAAYAASPPSATQLAEVGLGADSRRRWWCFQKHPVAITYNDHSVLENRHVAILYSILLKQESDVFSSLDRCGRGGWSGGGGARACTAAPGRMRCGRLGAAACSSDWIFVRKMIIEAILATDNQCELPTGPDGLSVYLARDPCKRAPLVQIPL